MTSNTAALDALKVISESALFENLLVFTIVMLILFIFAYIDSKLENPYVKSLFWYIVGLISGGALIWAIFNPPL